MKFFIIKLSIFSYLAINLTLVLGAQQKRLIEALIIYVLFIFTKRGNRWLSGRVLDMRLRGCGFEPHRRHCLVSMTKTLYPMLSTGSN